MIHYIIDGNNLIGKIKSLHNLQSKNKQSSREMLVHILNRHFVGKKIKLSLHFDGYPNTPLNLSNGRIIYSEGRTADVTIREEIDRSKNPKLITLISSDSSLMNYARVNSSSAIKSEVFYKEIEKFKERDEEAERINRLEKENKVFLELFTRK